MKLKPCPFCGGRGYVKIIPTDFGYGNAPPTYGIVCYNCFSQTSLFYKTEKEAVDLWNSRYESEGET